MLKKKQAKKKKRSKEEDRIAYSVGNLSSALPVWMNRREAPRTLSLTAIRIGSLLLFDSRARLLPHRPVIIASQWRRPLIMFHNTSYPHLISTPLRAPHHLFTSYLSRGIRCLLSLSLSLSYFFYLVLVSPALGYLIRYYIRESREASEHLSLSLSSRGLAVMYHQYDIPHALLSHLPISAGPILSGPGREILCLLLLLLLMAAANFRNKKRET